MENKWKYWLGAVGALTAVWAASSPRLIRRPYERELFRRRPDEEEPSDIRLLHQFDAVENRQVWFPSVAGTPLHGWFFKHPSSDRVIFYHIGRNSDIVKCLESVKLLLDCGASVFIYEYRGFGLSPGRQSLQHMLEDACSAYAYLELELGYTADKIVILGESLGTAPAGFVANAGIPRCIGLILDGGFSSLEDIAKERTPVLHAYRSWQFPPHFDNQKTAENCQVPLLVIHGRKDDVIPIHHALKIVRRAKRAKRQVTFWIMRKSRHTDFAETQDRDFAIKHVREWLASL